MIGVADYCRRMTMAPSGKACRMYVGYIPAEAAQGLLRVADVRPRHLAAAGETMLSMPAGKAGLLCIGEVPAGAWILALLPAGSGLRARRDTGTGLPVLFEENAGAEGTGANGARIRVGDTDMLCYGELSLVGGTRYMHID